MIKAALIDDERSSLESLAMELGNYCADVEIIATFNNSQEALKQLPDLQLDVIFLDIQMPGLNGFELLQRLSDIPFDVIFVTAYDQYALRAFDFSAIDYLLKPTRKNKLIDAVNKVKSKKKHHFDQEQLLALLQNIQLQQTAKPAREKIALPTSEGYSLVGVEQIIYLVGESNYTWVHTASKDKYLVSKTLKEIEALIKFPNFFRVHKSYVVNINHINRYVRGQGGYLVTNQGQEIPVSRSNKANLMKYLKEG